LNEVIERRLDFLKLEAEGFSLCEIVKELSKKYQKTERTVYYDASTRETWQPLYTQLFELDKARLMVINRYSHIYREASFNYSHGDPTQKPIYLKIMLDVTKSLIELLGLQSIRESQEIEQRRAVAKQEGKELIEIIEQYREAVQKGEITLKN
jgi:hypothetical protein